MTSHHMHVHTSSQGAMQHGNGPAICAFDQMSGSVAAAAPTLLEGAIAALLALPPRPG